MPRLLQQRDGERVAHPLAEHCSVGRSPECDVLLQDASISRKHASLRKAAEGYLLVDEGSRFGTFVNGAKISAPTLLKHRDELRFGSVAMLFDESGANDGSVRQTGAPASFAESLMKIGELTARVEELEREKRKSESLLKLQGSLGKVSSLNLMLQGASTDLLRALRGDKVVALVTDPVANQLVPVHAQGLATVPPSRVAQVLAAVKSGEPQRGAGSATEAPFAVGTFRGRQRGLHGVVYVELPLGRPLLDDDFELFVSMCERIAAAADGIVTTANLRKQEEARANLSRFVSQKVVEAVMAGEIKIDSRGEERSVSVLFIDVRGFTSLSEKLPPPHVLALLNDYFGEAVPVIKEAEGTVDKFIGDALMAVFGAPNRLEDHAARAVRAALAIQAKVLQLREKWKTAPFAAAMDVSAFSVGMGINTGVAIAGNLGTSDRSEYAVIGDAVNVASRLCSNAKPGELLIGPLTAEAVKTEFDLRALEPLKVKGRQQAVQAFSVGGKR